MFKKAKRMMAFLLTLVVVASLVYDGGYAPMLAQAASEGQEAEADSGAADTEGYVEPSGESGGESSDYVDPSGDESSQSGTGSEEIQESSGQENQGAEAPAAGEDPAGSEPPAAETPAQGEAPVTEAPQPTATQAPTAAPTVTPEPTATPVPTEAAAQLVQTTLNPPAEGAQITLKGMMPEGATATAVPANVEIAGQEVLAAYDITIRDAKGAEYQPQAGAIEVKIVNAAVQQAEAQDKELSVYHMETAQSQPVEITNVEVAPQSVTFAAESFSIYSIVTPKPIATYEYYSNGNLWATQKYSAGETIKKPKIPDGQEHQKFVEWRTEDGKTFDGFGTKQDEIEKDTTYRINAYFQEVYYVFFMDKPKNDPNGKVIATKEVKADAENPGIDVSDVSVETDADHAVTGWVDENGNDSDSISEVKEDITLYPVIEAVVWITYDTDGGSIVDPTYAIPEQVPQKPKTDPTKAGYTFGGWLKTKGDPDSLYKFDEPIKEATTLYAYWIENEKTAYTVIFWKQKATDKANDQQEKHYDYAGSETRYTSTGNTVSVQDSDIKDTGDPNKGELNVKDGSFKYFGFQYNAEKTNEDNQGKTAAADGSTILNVYFDRIIITLNFQYSDSRGLQTHKGLWGSNLDFEWDSDVLWEVSSENGKGGITTFLTTYDMRNGDATKSLILNRTWKESARTDRVTVIHYTEDLDGKYQERLQATGTTSSTALRDKFEGFSYKEYQVDGDGWREKNDDNNPETSDLETGVLASGSTLEIRHKRNSYSLEYINGKKKVDEDVYVDNPYKKESVKFETPMDSKNIRLSSNDRPDNVPEYYEFVGWCEDSTLKVPYTFKGTMPAHSVVLYAKWEPKKVDVIFDYQNDQANDTIQGMTAGNLINPDAIPADPTWKGHTFAGWQTAEGEPFNFDTQKVTATVTLYAKWITNGNFTVTYDPNGAVDANGGKTTQQADPQKYGDGSEAKLLSPSKWGWKAEDSTEGFLCWTTDEEGNGTVYYPGDKLPITGSIILYAQWTKGEKVELVYNYNGGRDKNNSEGPFTKTEMVPHKKYPVDDIELTRDGYYFVGWQEEGDTSGKLYQKDEMIAVDTVGDNVLVAQWKKLLTVTVSKQVEGNMTSSEPYDFKYSVSSKDSETVADDEEGWTSFQVAPGGTYVIPGLREGDTITVKEDKKYASEGYETQIVAGGQKINGSTCTVTVKDDMIITFTNKRNVVPPTGLTDNMAPFTAMILAGLGAAVVFFRPRRRRRL